MKIMCSCRAACSMLCSAVDAASHAAPPRETEIGILRAHCWLNEGSDLLRCGLRYYNLLLVWCAHMTHALISFQLRFAELHSMRRISATPCALSLTLTSPPVYTAPRPVHRSTLS